MPFYWKDNVSFFMNNNELFRKKFNQKWSCTNHDGARAETKSHLRPNIAVATS